MSINVFEPKSQFKSQKKEIISAVKKVFESGNYILGKEVLKLEKKFSSLHQVKYGIAVKNGTDAISISLKALGVEKGDEVITTSHTALATIAAIISTGAVPVIIDIEKDFFTINADLIEKKINKKTKAIIPVHIYGQCSDMQKICKIANKYKLFVIEDCAQAHGAKIYKKHVGTFGDIGTFSFFPGKNIGAFGDGGALVTNSKKIYEYAIRARNHGAMLKYDHKFSGRNSRLDCIQAAVLNVKLKSYSSVIYKRNRLAKIYLKMLSKIKEVEVYKLKKNNTYVFHQFVIKTKKRDKLRKFLKKSQIDTMIHYPYMLNELKFFPNTKNLKNSKGLGKKILSLPISEEHTEKEIYFVVKKIKEFFNY